MTSPYGTLIPALSTFTVASQAVGLTPMTAGSSLSSLTVSETDSRGASRYVLVGSAAGALATLVSGCQEPQPAPLANESAIPPNQSPCRPDSTSPYCASQREVLHTMEEMREEGHHSDQSLFFIGGGITLLLGLTVGLVLGRRWGRKKAERRIAEQGNPQPQPPPQSLDASKVESKS